MSSAKKLSDPDRTLDLVLPESITKTNMKRPTLELDPSRTQQIKVEQKALEQQIQLVQTEKVRAPNESTAVFESKQLELAQKIKELESKKALAEKELGTLSLQKNAKLYEDLKKATDVLVVEIKKISPVGKELENGIAKIANLKQELQLFFEAHLTRSKKGEELYENQLHELNHLSGLIKDCTRVISDEYHLAIMEIAPLNKEKVELINNVAALQSLIALKENEFKLLGTQKEDIEKTIFNLKDDIREFEKKAQLASEKTTHLKDLEDRLVTTQASLNTIYAQKERLVLETDAMINQHSEMHQAGSRLQAGLDLINDQFERKKAHLSSLTSEEIETRKRVESLKNSEINLMNSSAREQIKLTGLQTEAGLLEAAKDKALKLQAEAQEFYLERKEFYQKAAIELEVHHKQALEHLDVELERKRFAWEQEFKVYTQNKEHEQSLHLEKLQQEKIRAWEKTQDAFLNEICNIFAKYNEKENFSSSTDRLADFKNDIKHHALNFFMSHHTHRSYMGLVPAIVISILTISALMWWKLSK